jgi:hypothetical protein
MNIDELIDDFENSMEGVLNVGDNLSDRVYRNTKSALRLEFIRLQSNVHSLTAELEIIKAEITDKTGITRDEIDKFIEGQVKRHAKTN